MPFQLVMQDQYELINLHTGQHYDTEMKEAFVKEIKLDVELSLLATDREKRMQEMTCSISNYINRIAPDLIVVYGDTDTTLATAFAARDSQIALCHIEAGLRSFNMEMPEEVNRIETDKLSQLLLCPSQEAIDQLRKENIVEGVHLVGDIMKDAIIMSNGKLSNMDSKKYYYATLHRPYNVDQKDRLIYVLEAINKLKESVILPLHPRTSKNIDKFNISKNKFSNIEFIKPQSYMDNLRYMKGSIGILTDSGGLQKEAYWINKKCITLRSETEWKETLSNGCNTLMFEDLSGIQEELDKNSGPWNSNLYGDGNAMQKIKLVIDDYFKRA